MRNFQIFTDRYQQFREALRDLTDEKIRQKGAVCNQTVMDLRDVCRFLSSKNDEIMQLERLAETAKGIISTSTLPMPEENRIEILRESLQELAIGIRTYIAQITGEVNNETNKCL